MLRSCQLPLENANPSSQINLRTIFLQQQKPSKLVYKRIIQDKATEPKPSQEKWIRDCLIPQNELVNWQNIYKIPFQYTKCTKLINFHFKLMRRRIATNSFLKKIKIKDTDQCTFCQHEPESLIHLFWTCNHTRSLWTNLSTWCSLSNILTNDFTFTAAAALGLRPAPSNFRGLITVCLLIARYFIWQCRLNQSKPTLKGYLSLLKHYKEVDTRAKRLSRPRDKLWDPISHHLSNLPQQSYIIHD